MRYCIWNNKGGVGKTFITYLLATEFALKHPNKRIIVVDLCPQSNISEILLGGNSKGEVGIEYLYGQKLTIAWFIKKCADNIDFLSGNFNVRDYFVKIHQFNNALPENLYLVPGDHDLDLCSKLIDYLASSPRRDAWKGSRSLLLNLINKYDIMSKDIDGVDTIYFFDCNPSFASYTELAILSSDRLIVPCTADNASRRGIDTLFNIIYSEKENQYTNFSHEVSKYNMSRPKVHRIIHNKSRSNLANASKAFKVNINETKNLIKDYGSKDEYKKYFSDENYENIVNIKDGNTLATVMIHRGLSLEKIKDGRFSIHNKNVQISKKQVESFKKDIENLIESVDTI